MSGASDFLVGVRRLAVEGSGRRLSAQKTAADKPRPSPKHTASAISIYP